MIIYTVCGQPYTGGMKSPSEVNPVQKYICFDVKGLLGIFVLGRMFP